MPKQQIRSDKLRQPSGVFSHATAIEAKGRLVFISGMTARRLDGSMAGVGDIEAQTRQVCENLKAVLEAAGSSLGKVAKVTIYMADLGELMAMNEVFSGYFPKDPPARTTFQAAGLVAGARVEIEAIAIA